MTAPLIWTAAEDATLKDEWVKGTSAREIARMLWQPEHHVTRSAVLGRAWRLGLGAHPVVAARAARPVPPAKLEVFPLTLAQANEMVAGWHRHHRPVVGHRYSLGVRDGDGTPHGAAIVGRPTGRKNPQLRAAR